MRVRGCEKSTSDRRPQSEPVIAGRDPTIRGNAWFLDTRIKPGHGKSDNESL
jgi:hypothetical protein